MKHIQYISAKYSDREYASKLIRFIVPSLPEKFEEYYFMSDDELYDVSSKYIMKKGVCSRTNAVMITLFEEGLLKKGMLSYLDSLSVPLIASWIDLGTNGINFSERLTRMIARILYMNEFDLHAKYQTVNSNFLWLEIGDYYLAFAAEEDNMEMFQKYSQGKYDTVSALVTVARFAPNTKYLNIMINNMKDISGESEWNTLVEEIFSEAYTEPIPVIRFLFQSIEDVGLFTQEEIRNILIQRYQGMLKGKMYLDRLAEVYE